MTTLYALEGEYQALVDLLEHLPEDHADADVDAVIDGWLAEMQGALEHKLDGVARFLRNLESDEVALLEEAARLREKADNAGHKAKRLKARVFNLLTTAGLTKVATPIATFAVQANGGALPVVVADDVDPCEVAAAHPDLVEVKTTINKDAVRKALVAGVALPFAHLAERGQHLRVK